MKTEEELHAQLVEYFTGLEGESLAPAMDIDGKFTFVTVAFCKPSDAQAFVKVSGKYPVTRADKAVAVGVALAQFSPDVELAEDGKTDSHSVISTGIHALCSSVAAKFMSEVALQQIVGQAQMVMRKRAELTDD